MTVTKQVKQLLDRLTEETDWRELAELKHDLSELECRVIDAILVILPAEGLMGKP